MDESKDLLKASELLNKKGVIDSSLIRPVAKLSVRTIKSTLRLHDDTDGDN